jgi:hypothetical protein
LAEELFFADNLENGPAVFYHPTGQLAMQGTYQDGEMIGECEFYNADGSLPEGVWKWRFAASQDNVRMQGQLRNGKQVGIWEYRAMANQGRSEQKRFKRCFDE